MKRFTLLFFLLFIGLPCISARRWIPKIAAAGGGGPTLVASDDFDSYINAEALADQTNWDSNNEFCLNIKKPGSDGSINPGGTGGACYYSAASFNANQRSEITIEATSTGGSFDDIGPAVRVQSGAATFYAAVFTAGDLRLIYVSAGTPTIIIQDNAMSLVAGNKIAIECSGAGAAARLKVQIDTGSGWVDKWTNQDPAVDIDGGKPGIGMFSQPGTVNSVDDWAGYDLP